MTLKRLVVIGSWLVFEFSCDIHNHNHNCNCFATHATGNHSAYTTGCGLVQLLVFYQSGN